MSGYQRKLAVLLHADVVGSTALVRRDETLAHGRIRDAFRRLADTVGTHGGVAREIRGDALVAEFPRASDAVAAALDFQRFNVAHNATLDDDLTPSVRIGIAMGEVVVEDATVTGEGIVIAQRLEQLAEPDGVCIQAAAQQTVPRRMPFVYEDLGERRLKGFDEPVRAYRVRSEDDAPPELAAPATVPVAPAPEDRPSIAVLPFENRSGDPEQAYFSDGIAEDLITELGRLRSLFVIARNSSFAYRGTGVDVRRVGRELGVRYVVEGSVRRAGPRVRVAAQLVEAESGSHIWGERYDRRLEDIFAVQEEVSRTIAATLLGRVEQDRLDHAAAGHPQSLAAHDCLLRGKTHLYRYRAEDLGHAERYLRQAIDISPGYAEALAWLALCHCWRYAGWWTPDPAASLAEALRLAHDAVEMDPALGQAHGSLAYALVYEREYGRALFHFRRAVELVPCDAENTSNLGWCLMFDGDPDAGLVWIERGERLNPLQSWWHAWLRGMAHYCAGRYEAALDAFDQLSHPPVEVEAWRAASHARLGDRDRALDAARRFEGRARVEFTLYPGDAPDGWRDYWACTQPFREERAMAHLLEGLRQAGIDT